MLSPSLTSKQNRNATTVGYFISFLCLGIVVAIIGPTLPNLAAQTQVQISQISYLFTARSFGFLLGAFFGGKIYDHLPGHPIITAGLFLLGISLFATPIIPVFWILMGSMLLLGIGESIIDVGTNTLLPWIYQDKVAPYLNTLHFFFGAGAFIAPIIVAQVILHTENYRAAYWLPTILIFLVAIWILLLKSPNSPQVKTTEKDYNKPMLAISLVVVFLFLYVGVETSFGGWIYTYAVTLGIMDMTSAAYLTSAFWGALTAGRLLSIPLAPYIRPRWIITGALIGGLASLAMIYLNPQSKNALWLGVVCLGLFLAPVFPTILSLVERNMMLTGQITGWFFAGGSLGGMIIPVTMGQLIEYVTPVSIMFAMFGLLLMATGIYFSLLRVISHQMPLKQATYELD